MSAYPAHCRLIWHDRSTTRLRAWYQSFGIQTVRLRPYAQVRYTVAKMELQLI